MGGQEAPFRPAEHGGAPHGFEGDRGAVLVSEGGAFVGKARRVTRLTYAHAPTVIGAGDSHGSRCDIDPIAEAAAYVAAQEVAGLDVDLTVQPIVLDMAEVGVRVRAVREVDRAELGGECGFVESEIGGHEITVGPVATGSDVNRTRDSGRTDSHALTEVADVA